MVAFARWPRVREFLVPHWTATHRGWGDQAPVPASRFMCRYTAEAAAALDPRWSVVLGRVHGQSHVWNETRGVVLDLTRRPVRRDPVTLRTRPASYLHDRWTDSPSGPYRARARRWLADQD